MGIRHLHTYMFKNCPGGVQEIDIRREINHHKRTYNVEKPVIIIDIVAIHEHVYTNETEKLFGGRFDLYNRRMAEVFEKLVDLGLEIICVQDGALYENKKETIIKRRNERYFKEWSILQQVDSNLDLKNSNLKLFLSSLTSFFSNLRMIAKQYSNVIITPREGDQEIVYQANKRNALAIISHDTDFLIFDGNWQFWSGPYLNLNKCSIIRFNKGVLRSRLSLSPLQMILFATISGNDFVKFEMVEQFHKKVCGRNKFEKLSDIVRRIRSLPPSLRRDDERYLINLIFRPEDRNTGLENLRESINFYCDVNDPVVYASRLLKEAPTFVYSILLDIPCNLSLYYFDLKKKDLTPYYQLIKPIIQRQIGTVLKNAKENLNSLTRPIITKLHHDDSYKVIEEVPIYPNDILPLLEDFILMPNQKNNNLYELKLKLFCWHILPECEYFTPYAISNLPDEQIITVAIITYLIEKKQICFEEGDDILLSCIHNFDQKQLINLDYFRNINERDTRIAFLFTKLYTIFNHSIQILGLKNFETLITFDGLYYHYLRHNKDKKHLRTDLHTKFKDLRIYIHTLK